MNKYIKIVTVFIVGVFLLILLIPVVFKGKVEALVKAGIDSRLDAKVAYKNFSLSLLKGFPNLVVGVEEVVVVGRNRFEGDTLMAFERLDTEVDVFSAMTGRLKIKSVQVDELYMNAMVLDDSTVNWDILIGGSEDNMTEEKNAAKYDSKIDLQSLIIHNARIVYTNRSSQLAVMANGLDLTLSGDLSQSETRLKLRLNTDALSFQKGGVNYLKDMALGWDAVLSANMNDQVFVLEENNLKLNKMNARVNGSLAVREEAFGIDLELHTRDTEFKSLLALVPELWLENYESLKTEGQMNLSAYVKGDYVDEQNIPSFRIDLEVAGGRIQYPGMPKAVEDIELRWLAYNPGGSPDSTHINIEQFHFSMGESPFDASLFITRPVSNPAFRGRINGKLDLGVWNDVIPMDSTVMAGVIVADLNIEGSKDLIDKGDYDAIRSSGQVSLSGIRYSTKDLAYHISVPEAELVFTPQALDLRLFRLGLGVSDFDFSGRVDNYLSYLLSDGILEARLKHSSKRINLNQLLAIAPDTEAEDKRGVSGVMEVPKDLDLELHSDIGHLVFDKLDVADARGRISVKNGAVVLEGLHMQTLGGQLSMSGQYNTFNIDRPYVDFAFSGENIDLNKAAHSFSVVDSMLPVAKNTVGVVAPDFKYHSTLAKDFRPVISTIDGGGSIKSEGIEVSGTKIQNGMAAMMKNERYKSMRAEDLDIQFRIEKGNVVIEPFTTNVEGKIIEIEGRQGVDQSIDYRITLPIERKELAGLSGLASLMGLVVPTAGEDLMVDVLVKGTVSDPKLSLNLDKATKAMGKDLEKDAKNAVEKFLSDPDSQKKIEDFGKKLKNIFK